MIKKLIFLISVFIVYLNSVYGIDHNIVLQQHGSVVPLTSYNGVNVKWYNNKIDKQECFQVFDSIPEKYFAGIRQINVGNIRLNQGYCTFSRIISIPEDCNKEILIHEMAHIEQINYNELLQINNHEGNFWLYVREIEGEL